MLKQLNPLKLSKSDSVTVAQEFHISVTPLGGDQYLVRIERVAPGVPLAEEQVSWPMEDWLTQARQLMNDPLLGVLQGNAAFGEDIFFLPEWDEPVSQSSLNLVALGQQLYNALFHGSLRDSWMMAQAIAQNQRQVLRLRLGLKGTRLPRLPWEVLHAGDRPLATGTDVAFSRYQLSTGLMNPSYTLPVRSHQPLKILMVVAGPSDQESLELAQEASHLQEELRSRSPNEAPTIELTILAQPGRERLTQALEQGQYQVFHYAGHSNLGDSGGDVYLVSDKTGLTETLNGDDLAGLLVNNGVQLAVFNSCRGVYTATSEAVENGKERNLAEALVKRGIPAVLAMAERIPDEVALTLTRLLYRNLNQGYPIDLSLSRARQGLIAAYGSNQLYWALPVLYLNPGFDGFLTNSNHGTHDRSELFALADPLEIPPALPKDNALFPRSGVLNSASFPDDEDDLYPPSRAELGEYDDDSLNFSDLDSDDPDGDDTSVFIRDLLTQLDSKPASSEPVVPIANFENNSKAPSDVAASALPSNPPNPQPSPQRESGTILPPDGVPQGLQPQTNNPINTTASVGRSNTRGSRRWWETIRGLPRLWMVLGTTGIIAIALLGFWFFQSRERQPGALLGGSSTEIPGIGSSPANPVPVDLKTGETSKVTALAIEQLSQGNIAAGQKTVEALLNREALQQASAALGVVPKSQLEDPSISFLKGRLAWQSIKKGSKDYGLSDARRFWYTAHKAQPKNSAYLTALGFAYYAEGDFDRANQAWFDALYLTEEAKGTQAQASTAKKDALTIYAGLAMGLRQSAQKQPAAKRANLLSESIKLRQKVLNDDPIDFQPNALSKNWLWTEKAIQDWRSLLAASK